MFLGIYLTDPVTKTSAKYADGDSLGAAALSFGFPSWVSDCYLANEATVTKTTLKQKTFFVFVQVLQECKMNYYGLLIFYTTKLFL